MKLISRLTACLSVSLLLGACGDKSAENAAPAETPAPQPPASKASGFIPVSSGMVAFDAARLKAARVGRSFCAIDKINGQAVVDEVTAVSSDLRFSGWILDSKLGAPSDFAVLLLGDDGMDSYAFRGRASGARPDVAAKFKAPAADHSGFASGAAVGSMKPGIYQVSLVQDVNGAASVCTTRRKIQVGAPG